MPEKSPVAAFTYWARNLRSRPMFAALRKYCRGDVLDVGGRDFYLTVRSLGVSYRKWTTLVYEKNDVFEVADPKFCCLQGDGCRMDFADNSFDTVLNIQVLEHVREPNSMVREISRVLKPSGTAVFLIPQTAVLHELPGHYYNFTLFWIEDVMKTHRLEIVEYEPLGGLWSSFASRQLFFFFQAARLPGFSDSRFKRNIFFYLFLPFMVVYVLISIPLCLFFSLGDLTEEPNNHLVVVRKQA